MRVFTALSSVLLLSLYCSSLLLLPALGVIASPTPNLDKRDPPPTGTTPTTGSGNNVIGGLSHGVGGTKKLKRRKTIRSSGGGNGNAFIPARPVSIRQTDSFNDLVSAACATACATIGKKQESLTMTAKRPSDGELVNVSCSCNMNNASDHFASLLSPGS